MARAISDDVVRSRLDHKAVLLDTDIVIKSFTQNELKGSVFPLLKEFALAPTITPEIRFEFLRSAFLPENYTKRLGFITDWATLIITPADGETAIQIGRVYRSYGLAPSLTDCLSAAVLRRFPGRLFLVTLNHKDFPPFLFERLYADVIDAKTTRGIWETLVWGMYAFDEAKYQAELQRLEGLRSA